MQWNLKLMSAEIRNLQGTWVIVRLHKSNDFSKLLVQKSNNYRRLHLQARHV